MVSEMYPNARPERADKSVTDEELDDLYDTLHGHTGLEPETVSTIDSADLQEPENA